MKLFPSTSCLLSLSCKYFPQHFLLRPTRLLAGRSGSRVRFPAGAGNFCLYYRVQDGSGTHPASYPMRTGGVLSLGVKWPGREAGPSSPRSRMRGAIPPLPQHVIIAWCLVKHKDNFTFTFYLTSFLDILIPFSSLRVKDKILQAHVER
jgi:hypothetical protein